MLNDKVELQPHYRLQIIEFTWQWEIAWFKSSLLAVKANMYKRYVKQAIGHRKYKQENIRKIIREF